MQHALEAYPFGRYYPRWQGLSVGWREIRAGLLLIPQPVYMLLAALLPLLTSATLLLDAAPAIPNVAVGAGVTIAFGIVGWLIKRVVENSDAGNARLEASNARVETAVATLTKLVGEIDKRQENSDRLNQYLEKRIESLEHKKETLEKAFVEMDKIIDREIIHKKGH